MLPTLKHWKLMKMLIKSNKGSNSIPPLQNITNDPDFTETVYDDLSRDSWEYLLKF